MKNYLDLAERILVEGQRHNNTYSLFGEQLTFDLRKGFPIVTTRKVNPSLAIGELYCFTKGFTDIRDFQKAGVNFWNADCKKDSWQNNANCTGEHDLGRSYGYEWTKGFGFNQLENLITNLKANPSSRRHILTTFNPKDIKHTALPWCYVSHQFYVEKGFLNMLVHQRSADFILGMAHDLVSFALLQSLMAKEIGLAPKTLKVIIGDAHIYDSHVDKAAIQLSREPFSLPKLKLTCGLSDFEIGKVKIGGYASHPAIKFPFEVQEAQK